jgi:hypothetical protein
MKKELPENTFFRVDGMPFIPNVFTFTHKSEDGSSSNLNMTILTKGPPGPMYLESLCDRFHSLVHKVYQSNDDDSFMEELHEE